jgi:hypothetical protein
MYLNSTFILDYSTAKENVFISIKLRNSLKVQYLHYHYTKVNLLLQK